MEVTLLMEVETVYRSRHLWRKKHSVEVETIDGSREVYRSRHLWRKKYSVEVETVYESDTIDGSRDSL